MTWIKTPTGDKLHGVVSFRVSGQNLIADTPKNHELIMECPSEDYARDMMQIIQTKISNGEEMIDLTTLKI